MRNVLNDVKPSSPSLSHKTDKCHLVRNKIYIVTQLHYTFHRCLIHAVLTKMTMSHHSLNQVLNSLKRLHFNPPSRFSFSSVFSSRRAEPQARQGARCSGGGGLPHPGKLPRGGRGKVQPPAFRNCRQPRQEEDKSAQGERSVGTRQST